MSKAIIYATTIHKQREKNIYFAFTIWQGKDKKPLEYSGQFQGSKEETQLKTLIHCFNTLTALGGIEDVNVISDFAPIQKITNASLGESNDWLQANNKPIRNATLWQNLWEVMQSYHVLFTNPEKTEPRMVLPRKLLKEEQTKERTPINLTLSPETLSQAKTEVAVGEEVSAVVDPEKSVVTDSSPQEVTLKIEADLLREAEVLFGELGLTTQQAVTIFLKHSIRNQGISLDLKL